MRLMMDMSGKTALVTGAANGIGLAIAQNLARLGADVVMCDKDKHTLEMSACEVAKDLTAGNDVRSFVADLHEENSANQIVDFMVDVFGSVDIIVNNAGYALDTVIQKMTDEMFGQMIDIHCAAPFRIIRTAQPFFKAQFLRGSGWHGSVVCTTSITARDGNVGQAGYGAGKAGVVGLVRTAARELGRYNVCVNAVGYGLTQTRMMDGVPSAAQEAYAKESCLGRLVTPQEAANVVTFLCSQ